MVAGAGGAADGEAASVLIVPALTVWLQFGQPLTTVPSTYPAATTLQQELHPLETGALQPQVATGAVQPQLGAGSGVLQQVGSAGAQHEGFFSLQRSLAKGPA